MCEYPCAFCVETDVYPLYLMRLTIATTLLHCEEVVAACVITTLVVS